MPNIAFMSSKEYIYKTEKRNTSEADSILERYVMYMSQETLSRNKNDKHIQ